MAAATSHLVTRLNLIALMRIRHLNEFRPDEAHWVCPDCQKQFSVAHRASLFTAETLLEFYIEDHESRVHGIGGSDG